MRTTPFHRRGVAAGMASLVGVGIADVASYPLSLRLDGGTAGYGAMTALLGGGDLPGAALAGRVLRSGPACVLAAACVTSAAGLALAEAGRGLGAVANVTLIHARVPNEVCSAESLELVHGPPGEVFVDARRKEG